MHSDLWSNVPNQLPADSDTSTRFMASYFIFWLIQFTTCFFRPHQIRWLFTFKAFTMPMVCFGIFIWALVRSGGPGSFQLSTTTGTSEMLAWTFMGAINAAINGEFGPLIASERKLLHGCHIKHSLISLQLISLVMLVVLVTRSLDKELQRHGLLHSLPFLV